MNGSQAYKRNPGRRAKMRRALIHRDGPDLTCHLCGGAIDLDRKYPDPFSLSMDHVHPLSLGGDPWALDGIKAAHLVHNQSRGNRSPVQKKQQAPHHTASRSW